MLLTYDYFLFAIPGMALSMWAQARISRAYAAGSRIPARAGVTGAEAAAMVMRAGGATGVAIEPVAGELSDHYDPRKKVLRLSDGRLRQPLALGGRNRRPRGRARHSGRLSLSRPGRPQPDRADGQHRLHALLGTRHGRAGSGPDETCLAGDHPLFADGRLSAREPARRVQRQPPRAADPAVDRADQPRRRSGGRQGLERGGLDLCRGDTDERHDVALLSRPVRRARGPAAARLSAPGERPCETIGSGRFQRLLRYAIRSSSSCDRELAEARDVLGAMRSAQGIAQASWRGRREGRGLCRRRRGATGDCSRDRHRRALQARPRGSCRR